MDKGEEPKEDNIPSPPEDAEEPEAERKEGAAQPAQITKLPSEGSDGLLYRREGRFWKRRSAGFACPVCGRPIWLKTNEAGKKFTCDSCGSRVRAPVPALGTPAISLEDDASLSEGRGVKAREAATLPPPKPERGDEDDWVDFEPPVHEKKEIVAGGTTPESAFASEEVVREEWEDPFSRDTLRAGRESLARKVLKTGAALFVLAIAGLILFEISNESRRRKVKPQEDPGEVTRRIPGIVTAEDRAGIEAVLDGYFQAGEVEDKARHVRHPEETIPRMREYFGATGFPAEDYKLVENGMMWEQGENPFLIAMIAIRGGIKRSVAFEPADEGFKMDWESFVGYSPMRWDVFVSSEPAGAMDFRVKATLDDYFNYGFDDEEEFICLNLTDLDASQFCYGYLEKEHPDAARIVKIVEDATRAGSPNASLLLRLEFPPGSPGRRQVRIVKMIHDNWLFR